MGGIFIGKQLNFHDVSFDNVGGAFVSFDTFLVYVRDNHREIVFRDTGHGVFCFTDDDVSRWPARICLENLLNDLS